MAELNPPLGTTTPEIFMDNVKRADELVNGPAGTVNDRGGEPLDTWRQMMAKNDEIRQNLIPLSRQYMTLAAAQADIANIPVNSTTYVRSQDGSALADEYINNGGTLEATGRKMPSQQGVIEEIDSRLVPGPYSPKKFPLWHDENENVPIWLDRGLLDAAGLGPVLRNYIKSFMNDTSGSISSADKYFINGDLFKFIFKRGQVFNGDAVSLNIAFTGDSWTEISTIPKSLINVLGGVYKDPGWISCSTQSDTFMSGISLVATNFTKYDGGNRTVNPPPYGSGPDGNAYYNNNTVGTLVWSGVTATDLSLFYYDGSGAFTITIDGGTPVTVTGANTGTAKKYDITGLTATAHTVTIQSLGVGVVSVFGMYGKNNSIRSGITVSRIGNGGAIASDYLNWSQWIPQTVQNIDVDLLFIILGTNDFRLSFGLDQYISGISEIITKYKTATPGICICLVSPAQSNATGTPALSEYDTAMRKLALDNNLNFISGYEIFPKTYDNSNGAWNDNLHLSTRGAYVLTHIMKDNFLKD